ncbi:unnamed protein product [Discosporangium mesarthrocarpum]
MRRRPQRGQTTIMDAFLGLGVSVILGAGVSNTIKLLVGRPRPNYAALKALSDGTAGSAFLRSQSFMDDQVRSFPSGHSSKSMAGTAMVPFLVWGQLCTLGQGFPRWARTALVVLSLLVPTVSLWVGVTRVTGYWHFQDDVATGWLIGGTSAAISYIQVVRSRAHHHREPSPMDRSSPRLPSAPLLKTGTGYGMI